MPWSIGGACFLQHFIDGCFVLIPFFTVPPVLICDLPLFFRCILTQRESFKLGVFIDLYPEFDDHSTPVIQFFFKFVDFVVSTFPVIFTAKSFDPFYHDSAIPGSVEDSYMTGAWKPGEETPEEMSGFFIRKRTCNRKYFVTARI